MSTDKLRVPGTSPSHTRASLTSGYYNNRLSRTNTTETGPAASINESVRTMDKLPTAKPTITQMDKLWTQIDVLDDVNRMSEEVRVKGSFFNESFEAKLIELKQLQSNLLQVMSRQHANEGESQQDATRESSEHLAKVQEEEPETDTTKHEKLNQFFNKISNENDNHMLYRKTNFDEMNDYVENIRINLQKVGESMKNFDETTKDLW